MDDRTAADLDLVSVFRAVDRTTSTLGQQALFHRLHVRGTAVEAAEFGRLVDRFGDDPQSLRRAQEALSRLQHPHGYDVWWLGEPGAVERCRWHAVFPVLGAAALAAALATAVWSSLWPVLVAMVMVVLAVRLRVVDRIGALGAALGQIAPLVATGGDLAFLADARHPVLDRLRSDVASLARLKTVARWLSGDPLMLSASLHPLAMLATALVNTVYEYLNLVLLLDANGVYFAAADLARHGGALVRMVAAIGDIDAAASVAAWRAERADWTRPAFVDATAPWHLADVRHPLVEGAVANSVTLTPGRGALISGSNMSGKSTFLRTVGVNVVLGQALHTCLASRFEAPAASVRTCIGQRDDLTAGRSYYLAEVETALGLIAAAASDTPHLFLFDELFRGTNTVERTAAAAGVLAGLVASDGRARCHVVLAATHDDELGELMGDSYVAYHFSDRVDARGLTFDFRLRAGTASTRNAIALLAHCGAPAAVVNRARAVAGVLDARRKE